MESDKIKIGQVIFSFRVGVDWIEPNTTEMKKLIETQYVHFEIG